MPSALFYIFSALMLIFGALVVICRNPVASALSLVVSFIGLAGLFVSLDAYFIGMIQILVYAGAVMVLFLFIIMLLDIKAETEKRANYVAIGSAMLVAVVLFCQVGYIVSHYGFGKTKLGEVAFQYEKAKATHKLENIQKDLEEKNISDTKLVGLALFKHYPLQIQLVGVLLLVGTLGVVIMSKREEK